MINRLIVTVTGLILVFAIINNLVYWAIGSAFAFMIYLVAIIFLTFEFVHKIQQVCKLSTNNIKNSNGSRMSIPKSNTPLARSMVKYTVLITICCCSTLAFLVFLVIIGFAATRSGNGNSDSNTSILQLAVIALGSILFNCDVFMNYSSIILQFARYDKSYYFFCFPKCNKKVFLSKKQQKTL